MHPDKKVGLALGILLIGITGAFFFRNEAPTDESPGESLQTAEALDRRIDRADAVPYAVTGEAALAEVPDAVVSEVIPAVPDTRDVRRMPAGDPSPIGRRARDILAPLPRPDSEFLSNEAVGRNSPEQTQQQGRRLTSASPSETPAGSHAADVTGNATAGDAGGTSPGGGKAPAFRVHEVVAGDNLSTLAERYLGSQSRYLKLYEANRDVLKSPDDLRVGMRLKIPVETDDQAGASKSAKSVGAKRQAASRSMNSGSDRTARVSVKPDRPVFVRPDRSPVIPRGRQTSQTGKVLGQVPPPGLPEVKGLLPESPPPVIASRPDENE